MANKGKAHIPSKEEWKSVYEAIDNNRHSIKNRLIMKLSECLGVRVKDIVKITVADVAMLDQKIGQIERKFQINQRIKINNIPPQATLDAISNKSNYKRKNITFRVDEFKQIIEKVTAMAIAGEEVDALTFYPSLIPRSPTNRTLALDKQELLNAISAHLKVRLEEFPNLKPTDFLIITQKQVPYSPGSLQRHIANIFDWAGINATSASGRRALLVDIVQNQKKPLEVAQEIAGHKNLGSTAYYGIDN